MGTHGKFLQQNAILFQKQIVFVSVDDLNAFSEVLAVTWSPDGKRLASGSVDKTVMIWDVLTGAPIGSPLNGHTGRVTAVAFSPDSKFVASGSTDRSVRLWDVQKGAIMGTPSAGTVSQME